MVWADFQTTVPGKWVLAGEHSVLKGATAIALPQRDVQLSLSFEPLKPRNAPDTFTVEPAAAEELIRDLLSSIAESWQADDRVFSGPAGKLKIESSIPIGAGFGSSAALCVALTRWMAEPLMLTQDRWMEFATQLEHRFHGRSSGMDVAVISAGEPISFVAGRGVKPIGIKQLPRFTFHDTGLRCRTSECVVKVEKFREDFPELAMRVDEAMGTASRLAIEGLIRFDAGERPQGLKLISQGMSQARECFYTWELVPGAAKRLEEQLLKDGALATKITGAGGGGMVVALWPE